MQCYLIQITFSIFQENFKKLQLFISDDINSFAEPVLNDPAEQSKRGFYTVGGYGNHGPISGTIGGTIGSQGGGYPNYGKRKIGRSIN